MATLLYPCDMVANDNVTLARVQTVALVREAKGIRIPADWGGAFSICPLPDLLGDGAMWMVDFTKVANVDRSFLRPAQRLRSLTEFGWAVFRQRLALAETRTLVPIDDLLKTGAATWLESELQARWVATGRDPRSFQDWLGDASYETAYPSRRHALEAGMTSSIREALDRELSPSRAVLSDAEPS